MIKTNLPVLLIRNMVLFPNSEVRIEIDSDIDKKVISLAEDYYDNQVLIVNPKDVLEQNPDITELPKVGIVGSVKMKIDMPNQKTRIIISGLSRVKVHTYTKDENIYDAVISSVEEDGLELNEELAYVRSLVKHVEMYVREVPYMSNTVLSQISGISDISQLTDIVALFLPITMERKQEYIEEFSATKRVKMILDDINRDIEVLKLEKQIELEVNKGIEESQKEFILREKIRVIKEELGDVHDKETEVDELRLKANSLDCPSKVKIRLNNEINKYENCSPNSPELGILSTYIDWLLNLPWKKNTKDVSDLNKVKDSLDKSHYALDTVKDRIIEYLAVKQNKNSLRSPIICLVGPPGVGKTTLAQSIAKSLNRQSTKISVGGVNDEAEIVGHRRTYVGAAPGLIIQGMKKAGTSNPVFIIDEIDKMTKDIKGDPASALLEVLDKEQNKHFVDHYIEEEFDLGNVMFIATANYIEQIPTELKDRLEIVELSSYTEYEKLDIAKIHLIPNLLEEHGLKQDRVSFSDEAILSIIRSYTKESGVRELDRLLATIIRKIVKDIVLDKSKDNYKITVSNISKYLGNEKYFYHNSENIGRVGVVNGLAYTKFGGDILPIETTMYKGKGELLLTGSLGEVMRESAKLAFSYIKANSKMFGIDDKLLSDNNIHIHVPEGAVPKDGPSAGVSLTTALVSLFTNKEIPSNIAMTGEMTLRGNVLPIGGLKEKVIGAHRASVRKIFIPQENERDLTEIPEEVKKDIDFVFVKDYTDIYNHLIGGNNESRRKRTNSK
ncbi:MAG: endopeptidase La [Firmicutes bacterium]|nr:endopeptidase La [Bacillota bacterium]